MSEKKKDTLIWIDMEMTGLDPSKEKIIEIATIITDSKLQVVAEGPNLIIHQEAQILRSMNNWNKKQHKKSGLLDAVKSSSISLKEAQRQTMDFISSYCIARHSPLCGNSVHHDRKFLVKYMPKIDQFLHYRHIDVSTVKELIQRWYPKRELFKKREVHRALDDIYESIEELRFYWKLYFK